MKNRQQMAADPLLELDSALSRQPLNLWMFHDIGLMPMVDASTDAELAHGFIFQNEYSQATQRNVEKEIARFLMWLHSERQRSIRQVSKEDLELYKTFLMAPPQHLVSPSKRPRLITDNNGNLVRNPDWRPFAGPLKDSSRRQAILVVKSFLHYAQKVGYTQRNPGALVKNVQLGRKARVERLLSREAIGLVSATIDSIEAKTDATTKLRARLKFMFHAYAATGARLSELVSADMGSLYLEVDTQGTRRWFINVRGKGSKERPLPATQLLQAYDAYLAAFGLARPVTSEMPLLLSTRREGQRITPQAAHDAMKKLFAAAAAVAMHENRQDLADELRLASTHWLRHSFATKLANAPGVPLTLVQTALGHASPASTAIYVHTAKHQLHDVVETQAELPPLGAPTLAAIDAMRASHEFRNADGPITDPLSREKPTATPPEHKS